MKLLKIESCVTCPYRAAHPMHEGIKNVPFCFNAGVDNKILPFIEAKKAIEPTAAPLNTIPDWCPLEDLSLVAQVLT